MDQKFPGVPFHDAMWSAKNDVQREKLTFAVLVLLLSLWHTGGVPILA